MPWSRESLSSLGRKTVQRCARRALGRTHSSAMRDSGPGPHSWATSLRAAPGVRCGDAHGGTEGCGARTARAEAGAPIRASVERSAGRLACRNTHVAERRPSRRRPSAITSLSISSPQATISASSRLHGPSKSRHNTRGSTERSGSRRSPVAVASLRRSWPSAWSSLRSASSAERSARCPRARDGCADGVDAAHAAMDDAPASTVDIGTDDVAAGSANSIGCSCHDPVPAACRDRAGARAERARREVEPAPLGGDEDW